MSNERGEEAILYYGAFRGAATAPLAAFAIKEQAKTYASLIKNGTVREIYMSVGERCPQCGCLTTVGAKMRQDVT